MISTHVPSARFSIRDFSGSGVGGFSGSGFVVCGGGLCVIVSGRPHAGSPAMVSTNDMASPFLPLVFMAETIARAPRGRDAQGRSSRHPFFAVSRATRTDVAFGAVTVAVTVFAVSSNL
jgi:hypothetical protein